MQFTLKPNLRRVTDSQAISDLRRVSREHGLKTVTARQYDKFGKYKNRTFYTRFGNWLNAQELAGLEKTRHNFIAGEQLFNNLKRVWLRLGRQPKEREMKKPLSKYNGRVYVNIYGGWWRALEWFVRLANTGPSVKKGMLTLKLRKKYKQCRNQKKRWVGLRLRFDVLRRDAYRCRTCGRTPLIHKNVVLHIDHVKPLAKGGKTALNNLRTLCRDCNIGKGDRSL